MWGDGEAARHTTGRGKSDWIGGGLRGVWEGFVDVGDVGWGGEETQARGTCRSYGGFVKFDRLTVRSNNKRKNNLS